MTILFLNYFLESVLVSSLFLEIYFFPFISKHRSYFLFGDCSIIPKIALCFLSLPLPPFLLCLFLFSPARGLSVLIVFTGSTFVFLKILSGVCLFSV